MCMGGADRTVKAAFRATIPIMLGYLCMGAAFGILLSKAGFHPLWALFISLTVYSGSMQFVAISLLSGGFQLLNAVMMTFAVNSRHIFYGFSLIDEFQKMGKKRLFMIFSLTDETYSLLCAARVPESMDRKKYLFLIALFNYLYWAVGCTAGAALGNLMTFDSRGIDFAMTALFIVIVTDQWKKTKVHLPAWTGAICAVACIFIFGAAGFVFPALLLITGILLAFRGRVERALEEEMEEGGEKR